MLRRAGIITAAVAVALIATALRLPQLSVRPFHGDEAVNAAKFRELWERNAYKYDPTEFHGPTLPYATLLAVPIAADTFAETTEEDYRIVTVAFGVALVGLTLCAAPAIGWPAALVAAFLTAISTAMAFYSRYYIHEVPLVVFTWGAILCGWRYALRPGAGWAVGLGICLALMHATKETAVLAWFAMALALIVLGIRSRNLGGKVFDFRFSIFHGVVGLFAATVVAVFLFSSFFTNAQGVIDSIGTFFSYAERGTGGEPLHLHPWHYYLSLLLYSREIPRGPWFSEALIMVLAFAGVIAIACQWKRPSGPAANPLARFLAVYTLALTVVYSVIPYKTPWCALGFLHGMTLLAGIGAVELIRVTPHVAMKTIVAALLLAGAVHLNGQTCRANFRLHTHRSNPYVYAHPNANIREIGQRVDEITSRGEGDLSLIRVVVQDNLWPLPFYLRRYNKAGYLSELPTDDSAAVVIVSQPPDSDDDPPAYVAEMKDRFGDRYVGPHNFGLRPGVVVGMYVKRELWESYLNRGKSTPE